MSEKKKEHRTPSIGYAVFVILGILAIVLIPNLLWKAKINLMFLLVWLFIYPACMHLGYTYKEINDSVYESIKGGIGSVLIILSVGALIGSWIISGTIPAIIYFGLKLVSPKIFLMATFLLCLLVSTACGTSWGAAGTAGVAMFAIGEGLGVPAGMTVGAIVSGSFFGDMLSPMSDSSNVASATGNVDLITHCKEMCWNAIPAALISALLYFILGLRYAGGFFDASQIDEIMAAISSEYRINFVCLLPLILLFVLLVVKIPPVFALLISALVSGLLSVVSQGGDMAGVFNAMWSGYVYGGEDAFLKSLLTRGGMISMASTGFMLMFSFGMVGALKKVGLLHVLVSPLAKLAKGVIGITAITEIVSVIGNMLGTGAFSLIVAGSVMKPAYEELDLDATNLTKAIASGSTPTVALVPWNISGIYIVGLFGVSVAQYAPFAFFSYVMPLITFLFVLVGFRVKYTKKEERV